jgi:energy-coupling factor transporter ATP-binding protein EcfA2
MSEQRPTVDPGKRALIAGRTGSGKSTLCCYLLQESGQHWVILNPKHTDAYKDLPDVRIHTRFKERDVARSIEREKFTLLNLSGSQASAPFMDSILQWMHEYYRDVGACADELYTLHNSGRAGDGLLGYLTRGRELRQSFIGLTQRPAWISLFLTSESDYIGQMDLVREDDRERMYQATGKEEFLQRITGYKFLWYDVPGDNLTLFGPVPATTAHKESSHG